MSDRIREGAEGVFGDLTGDEATPLGDLSNQTDGIRDTMAGDPGLGDTGLGDTSLGDTGLGDALSGDVGLGAQDVPGEAGEAGQSLGDKIGDFVRKVTGG